MNIKEYIKFDTPKSVSEWTTKAYSQQLLDYFDLNKQAICSPLIWYTGSMATRINKFLRKGILENSIFHFELLQADLCQQELPDNVVVYRYISVSESLHLWKNTMFGKIYENPCFISTTLLPKYFTGQAKDGRILITIYAPKGSRGMYITELKNAIVEYEVLFAHHTNMVRKGLFEFEILIS